MASRETLAAGSKGVCGQCRYAVSCRGYRGCVASGDFAGYGTLDRACGIRCPERSVWATVILQPWTVWCRVSDLWLCVVRLHSAPHAAGCARGRDAVARAGAPAFERAFARSADATGAALPV